MADALEALVQERDEGAWSDERYAEFLAMKQEIDGVRPRCRLACTRPQPPVG
jgi:hypothetical protein